MSQRIQKPKKSLQKKSNQTDTSWHHVSDWYTKMIHKEDSYQNSIILPNILRIVTPTKDDVLLDLACGEGFFGGYFSEICTVKGLDLAPDLVAHAQETYPHGEFIVADANDLSFLHTDSFSHCTFISAIQNIENISSLVENIFRSLKSGGVFTIVMNHPSFRIPKESDWGYDSGSGEQYRKIYHYMTEKKLEIDMNPGEKDLYKKKYTVSFHRPLQWYMKVFLKAGFQLTRFEEWVSHKKSEPGPKKEAEDYARKEIPLFLCIQLTKPHIHML